MTRLILFLSLLVGFVYVLVLQKYDHFPIENKKFNLSKAEKNMAQYKKQLALEAKKKLLAKKKKKKVNPFAKTVIDLKNDPNLTNGYNVYVKKGKCLTCHGRRGEGKKSQKAPKLAAQHDWYLYEQLVAIKTKKRINKVMMVYLNKLTDQDMKDVSTYLSKLPAE